MLHSDYFKPIDCDFMRIRMIVEDLSSISQFNILTNRTLAKIEDPRAERTFTVTMDPFVVLVEREPAWMIDAMRINGLPVLPNDKANVLSKTAGKKLLGIHRWSDAIDKG